MNSQPKHHLSDEALSDLLASGAGEDTPESLELKAALRSYRTETLAWAERRSATQPSLAAKAKASVWAAVPQWSLAAVAMVAIAAGAVHFAGPAAQTAAPAAQVSALSAPIALASPDQIAADNQLLGSIDEALQYETVSPTTEYSAQPARPIQRSVRLERTN